MSWSFSLDRYFRRCFKTPLWAFALSLATFASPTLAAGLPQGLDLAEALSATAIESMKADMSINFLEAALLEATLSLSGSSDDLGHSGDCTSPAGGSCSWPIYSLTDADGVLHTCRVREDTPKKRGARNREPIGRDVAKALDGLNGRCEMLRHEYWSYKWCHRKGITQFHELEDGTQKKINLGTYKRTEVKHINSPDSSDSSGLHTNADTKRASEPVLVEQTSGGGDLKYEAKITRSSKDFEEHIVVADDDGHDDDGHDGKGVSFSRDLKRMATKDDLYSGISDLIQGTEIYDVYEEGDTCEETGRPRQTRVLITCCAIKSRGTFGLGAPTTALLVSIHEVALCSYLVRVCSKLLCTEPADDNGQSADYQRAIGAGRTFTSPAATAGGVMGILEALEACFPTKQIGYWSYQLCFSKGMKQYHVEVVTNSAGNKEINIAAEYSLGDFNRSAIEGSGEDLIGRDEDGDDAIIVEFEGGTECDLTGVLRSSTVYLKCGMRQEVKYVGEDRTCHYKVEAESPLLCSHEKLVQKEESVRTVECIAEGDRKRDTDVDPDGETSPDGTIDGGHTYNDTPSGTKALKVGRKKNKRS